MLVEWDRHPATAYNRFVLDTEGTILASTIEHSSFVDTVIGSCVLKLLKDQAVKFLDSLRTAIAVEKTIFVDYNLGASKFIGAIQPIDKNSVFLHEHLIVNENRNNIIDILTNWTKASRIA